MPHAPDPASPDLLVMGPSIDAAAWVAPGAMVLGAIELGPQASVWYGCVLRGDGDRITVGARSNLQDGTIVHADPGYPAVIGADVAVGHRALLHGCTIEDRVLVGMGAIVLNGARIGSGSVIGAGSLITQGVTIPPNSLVLGCPGTVVRETTDAERDHILENTATYVELMRRHRMLDQET